MGVKLRWSDSRGRDRCFLVYTLYIGIHFSFSVAPSVIQSQAVTAGTIAFISIRISSTSVTAGVIVAAILLRDSAGDRHVSCNVTLRGLTVTLVGVGYRLDSRAS